RTVFISHAVCESNMSASRQSPPMFMCFFFQAEDGIRDRNVTGVQTCALPISASTTSSAAPPARLLLPPVLERNPMPRTSTVTLASSGLTAAEVLAVARHRARVRSEERRVGKEAWARWGQAT